MRRFHVSSFLQLVCVGSFSQTLRRYTSLNHLAQAARAVLQNSAQINQMLSDLNRVDFNNVQVCAAASFLSAVPVNSRAMVLNVKQAATLTVSAFPSGAGVLGVSVRRPRGAASGARL